MAETIPTAATVSMRRVDMLRGVTAGIAEHGESVDSE